MLNRTTLSIKYRWNW